MNLIKYLTRQQKTKITKMYNRGVRINKIAKAVNEPNLVVKQYLESIGAEVEGQYCYEVHGHLQMNDFYNCYLHQYIISKELQISIQEVKEYCIHHINRNKVDNELTNLWIFFDGATHMLYHSYLNDGDVGDSLDDIYLFSLEQSEIDLKNLNDELEQDIITQKQYNSNVKRINKYILLITKLYKKQKKILLQIGSM